MCVQKALREVKECVASGVTPEGLAAKVPEQEKGGGGKGRRKVKGEKEEKGDQGEEGGKGEGGDGQKTGKEDSSEQQVIFFFCGGFIFVVCSTNAGGVLDKCLWVWHL